MSGSGEVAAPAAGDAADEAFMRRAIAASRDAALAGNMPYGAVLAKGGRVLLEAGNEQRSSGDPSAHAEAVLMRVARERLGLDAAQGATVYASGEPCAMCCGAMFWSGVRRVVYAASQDSMARIVGGDLLPVEARVVLAGSVPAVEVVGPLLEGEAAEVLTAFADAAFGPAIDKPNKARDV